MPRQIFKIPVGQHQAIRDMAKRLNSYTRHIVEIGESYKARSTELSKAVEQMEKDYTEQVKLISAAHDTELQVFVKEVTEACGVTYDRTKAAYAIDPNYIDLGSAFLAVVTSDDKIPIELAAPSTQTRH